MVRTILNLSFDDMGANLVCPFNDGQTTKPENPLAALKGENAQGTWTLQVADGADEDPGNLTGWVLEICGTFTDVKLSY